MNDYERVARMIRFLDASREEQPDLATLARAAGLSVGRLHRLFTSWAGITPKDFLQCLTLAHARERLKSGESVLAAAHNAGLSGPGRLHDLCVSLEAATPGDVKSGGAGWTIRAGFAESPFGKVFIAEGPRGICALVFPDHAREQDAFVEVARDWPKAAIVRDDDHAARLARRIFVARPKGGTLRAFVRGTPFQVQVWRALLRIPEGALTSYGRLAALAGFPRASRAVGSAVGDNPISYLIPCHRVIRETGVLGNYRWDPVRKKAMLVRER